MFPAVRRQLPKQVVPKCGFRVALLRNPLAAVFHELLFLFPNLMLLHDLPDGGLQLPGIQRLEQIFGHLVAHSLLGIPEIRIAGQQHDFNLTVPLPDPLQQSKAILPWHFDIRNDEVYRVLRQQPFRVGYVVTAKHLIDTIGIPIEPPRHAFHNIFIVIYNQ